MGWGLALSGGGILGAAHLGVLKALAEWQVEPQVLAGTSAGGLVAGVLAAGGRLEDLTAYGARVAARPLDYLRPRILRLAAELVPGDPWPPPDSLLDSTRFVQGLVRLCPVRRVEAWRVPAALTAVDLAALEAVAFVGPAGSGDRAPPGWQRIDAADLAWALTSTMAIPGLFTPGRRGGRWLVDGGVADTLPVDWAAALGAQRVLAVDVTPAGPESPRRAGILWGLGRSLSYVTHTLSRLREPASLPVYWLAPAAHAPFPGFAEYPALVEAGYAAAMQHREAILAFLAGAADPSGRA